MTEGRCCCPGCAPAVDIAECIVEARARVATSPPRVAEFRSPQPTHCCVAFHCPQLCMQRRLMTVKRTHSMEDLDHAASKVDNARHGKLHMYDMGRPVLFSA